MKLSREERVLRVIAFVVNALTVLFGIAYLAFMAYLVLTFFV